MTTTTASIAYDQFYLHAVERVWQALTDPLALERWYARSDMAPIVGRDFVFYMPALPEFEFDGMVHCTVLEADPPRRLVYSDRRGTPGNPWFLNTVVSFSLEPSERDGVAGTLLRFEQSGFDLNSKLGQIAYPGMSQGWRTILSVRLRDALAGEIDGRL